MYRLLDHLEMENRNKVEDNSEDYGADVVTKMKIMKPMVVTIIMVMMQAVMFMAVDSFSPRAHLLVLKLLVQKQYNDRVGSEIM